MGDEKEDFTITSVHRNDLEELGYDATNVDDAMMRELASAMEEAYCETGFWIDLDTIADAFGIPKKKSFEKVKIKNKEVN